MKATSIPHQPPLRSKNAFERLRERLTTEHKNEITIEDLFSGGPLVSKSILSDISVCGA
jgi:hypothetical protein